MTGIPRALLPPLLPVAALLALGLTRWDQGLGLRRPAVASGDEPHYLLAINSLLRDQDLRLEQDYEQVAAGSSRAGERYRFRQLDHHTVLVWGNGKQAALWSRVYDANRKRPCPTGRTWCRPFAMARPGLVEPPAPARETPAHPPFYALVIAALLTPLPRSMTEPAVGLANLGLAALTLLALYRCGRLASLPPRWAALAPALAGLASPLSVYAVGFFPESLAALFVTVGLGKRLRKQYARAALAVALAAAVKPALAVVGLAWAVERALARDRPGLAAMVSVGGACALGLLLFNKTLLGQWVVAGYLGWTGRGGVVALRTGLAAWVDPAHGLLTFAPWMLIALLPLLGGRPEDRGLRLGVGLPLLLLWLLVSAAGSLGGYCFGPRYFVPLIPALALAAVTAAHRGRAPLRMASLALALGGLLIHLPAALQANDDAAIWSQGPLAGASRLVAGLRGELGPGRWQPLTGQETRFGVTGTVRLAGHPCLRPLEAGRGLGGDCPATPVLFGPYVAVPAGTLAQLEIRLACRGGEVALDLVSEGGERSHAALAWQPCQGPTPFRLTLSSRLAEPVMDLEGRLHLRPAATSAPRRGGRAGQRAATAPLTLREARLRVVLSRPLPAL